MSSTAGLRAAAIIRARLAGCGGSYTWRRRAYRLAVLWGQGVTR